MNTNSSCAGAANKTATSAVLIGILIAHRSRYCSCFSLWRKQANAVHTTAQKVLSAHSGPAKLLAEFADRARDAEKG
jgi:hypothetical protein